MVLGRTPNVQVAEICCGLLLNDFVSYCSYHFIIYIIKRLCLAWKYSGILILVGSVELDSDSLKDGSIMIPSCENSNVICSNCRWHPTGFISHCSMPATCPPNVAFNPIQARSILSASPISPIYAARYLNFVQAFRKIWLFTHKHDTGRHSWLFQCWDIVQTRRMVGCQCYQMQVTK